MKASVQLLRQLGLPVFNDENELASLIHVSPALIKAIVISPEKFYKKYRIRKANGTWRRIKQPNRNLKGIQAWILRSILDRINAMNVTKYATAYVKGKHITDNVVDHRNNRYFICLDLEDFFPSISMRRVRKKFSIMGYSSRASHILSRLCTCESNLPQGAVTSPALSNLVASQLDRRIGGYAAKTNMTYTRYSDDITLSSNNRTVIRNSLSRILKIIKTEHFTPNLSKLRVLGPGMRCAITGLVKHDTEELFGVGTKKKRQMRAVIHHYVSGSENDVKYSSEVSIYGWLEYLRFVDKASYEQMNNYLIKIIQKSIASK
jgi:RNA-directed DNA polymerase